MNKINRVGFGALAGIIGFIILAFGTALDQIWVARGGIVIITVGVWLTSWIYQ